MKSPAILADPDLLPIFAVLPQARLVGGCVRDMLACRDVADIDLATPDLPDRILAALAAAGLRALPTGLAHGTITAISNGRPFEITTLRRDEDGDGRHARVVWTDDFRQDAARRDFSINAMSLDQSGRLYDYFGGADDLRHGRVRFVGDAAIRIAEDYLRILRYFRFYARFGTPPPDPDATAAIEAACRPAAPGLGRLSPERIWRELSGILRLPEPLPALTLMHGLGVLQACLPEAQNLSAIARLVASGSPPDPILRLAALVNGDVATLADRLRLSGAERDRLISLRALPIPSPKDGDAEIRRLLAEDSAATLIDRTWLAGDASPPWQVLRRRLATTPAPIFPLEGRHAIALGAAPGPHIGRALRSVRAWWLEHGCIAGEEDCAARLRTELQPGGCLP